VPSPRDRLIIPLACAVTLMWLASGCDVLITQSPPSLEAFLAITALEGVVAGYVFKWSTSRESEA
jgi:hypothetical protein